MRLLLWSTLLVVFGCTTTDPAAQTTNELSKEELLAFLDTVWVSEQMPIRKRDSLGKVHGFESEEFQAQQAIYRANHAINEVKILDLLDTQGCPDEAIIGEQGSLTICNVLQHSSNEVRQQYLPMMRKAVEEKKLAPRLLARAEDRLATDRGELQVYGGQIKYYPETQSFDVWPIMDPATVDERRAAIGLEPMAEFLAGRRFQLEWDVEKQIERAKAFLQEKENAPSN
ncbi:MAG: DUF6624 domain-containing protein [Bacteroidota bacterium]